MSAYQLLQLSTQVLFVVIALVVLNKAIRQPWQANVDTALLFGTASVIVIAAWIEETTHQGPTRVISVGTSWLLIALPYLLVRLVDDFSGVPPMVSRSATAGFLLSEIAVVVFTAPYPGAVVLFIVCYFVVASGYVTASFIKAARRTNGVTQRRMQAAAAGTLCLGLDILVAGVAAGLPRFAAFWSSLSTMAGMFSGLFFFLGFAPPRWLRRAWQDPEVRAFLERASVLPRLPDTAAIVRELEKNAARAVGVLQAAIGLLDPETGTLQYRIGQTSLTTPPQDYIAGRAFHAQRPVFSANVERDDPEHAESYRQLNVRAMLAAPITAGDKRLGVLCVYASRTPLFADDDLSLVALLANQAAVILESRALIDEAARVRAREEAARLKDDFLSAAAHDLKTPLTAMVAQAQLLERRARRQPTAPPDLAGIERIVKESQRLRRLVMDLLDVSRVAQGKLVSNREMVDLVDVAQEACARHTTNQHRCILEAASPLSGAYDVTRIMQLIDNLLENAAKYSPAGGDITVRLWRHDASACITVTDQGIGIPATDLPHLFDRFHRGANVNDRSFAGMGLGLYICHGIVQQHGGRIWATSPGVGSGSTFHVELPLTVDHEMLVSEAAPDLLGASVHAPVSVKENS